MVVDVLVDRTPLAYWKPPPPPPAPTDVARYEEIIREKDDIIQAQYAELASTRERLAQAVKLLNEAHDVGVTSSNLGHG